MKKFVFLFISLYALIGLSACSNSCDSAKADVIKYMNQYLNAIYQGKMGASVPGGVETLQALEVAKKVCNRPDLTVEEIVNPEIAKLKAQTQQQFNQLAQGQNTQNKSDSGEDLGNWKIALATFGNTQQARERTIELSNELNALNIIKTRPAEASRGYFIVVSDTIYSSKSAALDAAAALEQKFAKTGIRLDINPIKSNEINN
jgi:hypothetical protein